jgi:hypothetical protein
MKRKNAHKNEHKIRQLETILETKKNPEGPECACEGREIASEVHVRASPGRESDSSCRKSASPCPETRSPGHENALRCREMFWRP